MKIAYIVPALVNKGPVLVVRDLVEQMVMNGQQCAVFFLDDHEERMDFPCPVEKIRFMDKINFNEFDIVHSHGIRPDFYVFCHKPSRCKTKFFTTLHNYVIPDLTYQYNKWVGFIFGYVWMFLLRRHDKIVTLTRDAVGYYSRWMNVSRLTFAYNTRHLQKAGLSIEERQQISEFKGNSKLIGVNAVLTDRKGVDQLIRALPELSDYKVLLIGEGKVKKDLQQLASWLHVEQRIMFAGYQKDAWRFLPYCDVYAMPSRSEGFGLSLLEAAVFKVAVVCSDIAVFRELFSPEEVVFFQLEDSFSLAEAIRCATGNIELAERMHQKYLECYSPEKFYKRYISIYQSLL